VYSTMRRMYFLPAYTLTELLIALSVLGVIATFTIPKILTAYQSQKSRASAKEMAAMIVGAYEAYKKDNGYEGTPDPATIGNMVITDLIPYMNYTQQYTGGLIDDRPGGTLFDCSTDTCYQFANGMILRMRSNRKFCNDTTLTALPFYFDPDGVYSGSTADSPGKAVNFYLYLNGTLRTRGSITASTCVKQGATQTADNPVPAEDPAWFGWN